MVIGVVGSTRRGALRVVTAGVRSTLSEPRAVASAVVWTPVYSGVRQPVSDEVRTGDADAERFYALCR